MGGIYENMSAPLKKPPATPGATSTTSTGVVPAPFRAPPFTQPRAGGGTTDQDVWTGGSGLASQRSSRPKSINARRPSDFRSAARIEDACTSGLREEWRLGPSDGQSRISLTSWIAALRSKIEECGMDGVFRVVSDDGKSETYLLDKWGSADEETVADWEEKLRTGVPDENGILQPPCPYDQDNLTWSGKMIVDSITVDLWNELEKEMAYDISGPMAFSTIIEQQQQSNDSAVRVLVDKLKELKLKKEPAQNVVTFARKVTEIAKRIEGSGGAPNDLTSLVAGAFLHSDVLSFNMEAIRLHTEADKRNSKISWEEIVKVLKLHYRLCITRSEWTPALGRPTANEEIAALKAALQKLTPNDGNGQGGRFGGGGGRRCWECGQEGHIARTCPSRTYNNGEEGENNVNEGENNGDVQTTTDNKWRSTPPKNNEPHERTVNGVIWLWCGRCKRWFSGSKAHLTNDHKTKAELEAAAAQSSAQSGHGGGGQNGNLQARTLPTSTRLQITLCENEFARTTGTKGTENSNDDQDDTTGSHFTSSLETEKKVTWWDSSPRQEKEISDDDVKIDGKWSDVKVDELTGDKGQTGAKPIRYWVNDVADNLGSQREVPPEDFEQNKVPKTKTDKTDTEGHLKMDFGFAGFLRS